MACESSCCTPPPATAVVTPAPGVNDDKCKDSCCDPETKTESQVDNNYDENDICAYSCCLAAPPVKQTEGNQGDSLPPTTCQDACCNGSAINLDGGKTVDISTNDDCCGPTVDEESCGSGCCAGPGAPSISNGDDCCDAPQPSAFKLQDPNKCAKDCCSSRKETTNVTDSSFPSKPVTPPEETTSCTSKSCSPSSKTAELQPEAEDPKNPNCCKGKLSPCCDTSCIERIALRECHGSSPNLRSRCDGRRDGKPCERHSRAARDKYTSTLDAIGCICRALLALGQESCCLPRERASLVRKRCSERRSSPRVSVDSCCASGNGTVLNKGAIRPRSRTDCDNQSSGDSCCAREKPASSLQTSDQIAAGFATNTDLEKGMSDREHVILTISGMTCTGCETKLHRTLGMVSSIINLKTSMVLSRAEFDIDLARGSVSDVMNHLERTTEFKCERMQNQGASVDLVTPGGANNFAKQDWPIGVTDIIVLDNKTARVAFDAKIIGARDLVEKGWGTPFELASLRPDANLEAGSKHVRYLGYMTLLSIVLTIPVLVLAWAPLPDHDVAYGSASLALATVVQVVIAGPFYPRALKAFVFSRVIEMDLLIVSSTTAAYVFSVVSFGYLVAQKPLSTGEFFETSTLLVTLIMVGRYVAALARQKAVESISIRSLQVSTAILVNGAGSNKEVDSRLLQYGDIFKVMPDSRIPTDGTVISGSSEVDESMLTGESLPVEKYAKSQVIAGSVNGSGTLTVRLTRLPGDNTISTIATMVDSAKLSKPKVQAIADRVASYFVPVVVSLTAITFAIWIAVGVAVRHQAGSEATIQAITYAITVLIVSCPCAIGLAVPMVVVIASGVAAERGVIFKSADSIELAYKTSHVVFDKTGTLTQGKLAIVTEEYRNDNVNLTRSQLLGLISSNRHPVSTAVAAYLKSIGVIEEKVSNTKSLTGKGVEGTLSGAVLRAGNSRWLGCSSDPIVQSITSKGHTAFCFTIDGSLAGAFGLVDALRADARSTIDRLHAASISVHIVSGDDDGAVRSVAAQLDVPSANIRSLSTPADKKDYIQRLLDTSMTAQTLPFRKGYHKPPVVVFCGDGTNDAVALAQATIGVHMNEGTDVAQSASDVVLMRPALSGVLTMIAVSRKSMRRVAFNFGWSFVYNLFAILLAAGAFVNARIPPEFAGLGELVSVLPVIAAAVLLRWARI